LLSFISTMPSWLLLVLTLLCGVAAYIFLGKSKPAAVKAAKEVAAPTPKEKKTEIDSLLGDLPTGGDDQPATAIEQEAADHSQITFVKDSCAVSDKRITFDLTEADVASESAPEMLTPTENVTIKNNSMKMGVFKVRTNRRHRYIVQPSIAYLKPGESKQVKIQLRKSEVGNIISADENTPKKKTDTFLVQWMNLKNVFYYNQTFFDSIKLDTWLQKASDLIKTVEKDNPTSPERRKFFHYEKIYVHFARPSDGANNPMP